MGLSCRNSITFVILLNPFMNVVRCSTIAFSLYGVKTNISLNVNEWHERYVKQATVTEQFILAHLNNKTNKIYCIDTIVALYRGLQAHTWRIYYEM